MWYQYAKEKLEKKIAKEKANALKTEPRLTDGETKHNNVRPNPPTDNALNKDGMNRPENVRHGAEESKEAA